MAWLVAALIRGGLWLFKTRLGLFIASAAVWLGINWGTMTLVIGPTVDALRGFAEGSGSSGTGQYWEIGMAWMGVLNFDRAITMIISAVATKHAVMQGRLFLFKRGVGAG